MNYGYAPAPMEYGMAQPPMTFQQPPMTFQQPPIPVTVTKSYNTGLIIGIIILVVLVIAGVVGYMYKDKIIPPTLPSTNIMCATLAKYECVKSDSKDPTDQNVTDCYKTANECVKSQSWNYKPLGEQYKALILDQKKTPLTEAEAIERLAVGVVVEPEPEAEPDAPTKEADVPSAKPKIMRFIYAIPSNKVFDPKYEDAIKNTALVLKNWFFQKMNGKTFTLGSKVVETVKLDKNAEWYKTGSNGDDNTFRNIYEELNKKIGVTTDDPNNIWVIYADVPDNKGRGGSGVCIMPGEDLLGLTGNHPDQKNINRWIMGAGHEIGHALGLNHPPGCDEKSKCQDENAMMWNGIYLPDPINDSYLTDADKIILNNSPFFTKTLAPAQTPRPEPPPTPEPAEEPAPAPAPTGPATFQPDPNKDIKYTDIKYKLPAIVKCATIAKYRGGSAEERAKVMGCIQTETYPIDGKQIPLNDAWDTYVGSKPYLTDQEAIDYLIVGAKDPNDAEMEQKYPDYDIITKCATMGKECMNTGPNRRDTCIYDKMTKCIETGLWDGVAYKDAFKSMVPNSTQDNTFGYQKAKEYIENFKEPTQVQKCFSASYYIPDTQLGHFGDLEAIKSSAKACNETGIYSWKTKIPYTGVIVDHSKNVDEIYAAFKDDPKYNRTEQVARENLGLGKADETPQNKATMCMTLGRECGGDVDAYKETCYTNKAVNCVASGQWDSKPVKKVYRDIVVNRNKKAMEKQRAKDILYAVSGGMDPSILDNAPEPTTWAVPIATTVTTTTTTNPAPTESVPIMCLTLGRECGGDAYMDICYKDKAKTCLDSQTWDNTPVATRYADVVTNKQKVPVTYDEATRILGLIGVNASILDARSESVPIMCLTLGRECGGEAYMDICYKDKAKTCLDSKTWDNTPVALRYADVVTNKQKVPMTYDEATRILGLIGVNASILGTRPTTTTTTTPLISPKPAPVVTAMELYPVCAALAGDCMKYGGSERDCTCAGYQCANNGGKWQGVDALDAYRRQVSEGMDPTLMEYWQAQDMLTAFGNC